MYFCFNVQFISSNHVSLNIALLILLLYFDIKFFCLVCRLLCLFSQHFSRAFSAPEHLVCKLLCFECILSCGSRTQEVLRTLPAELVAEAQLLRDRVTWTCRAWFATHGSRGYLYQM